MPLQSKWHRLTSYLLRSNPRTSDPSAAPDEAPPPAQGNTGPPSPPSPRLPSHSQEAFSKARAQNAFHYAVNEESRKYSRFPVDDSPNVDAVRKKFADALTMKKAAMEALADAECKCLEWEGTTRHYFGEEGVQGVVQMYPVIEEGETDTLKGRYITAVSHIKMHQP